MLMSEFATWRRFPASGIIDGALLWWVLVLTAVVVWVRVGTIPLESPPLEGLWCKGIGIWVMGIEGPWCIGRGVSGAEWEDTERMSCMEQLQWWIDVTELVSFSTLSRSRARRR